ncbi:Protein lifeguard 2 [Galemys pyrenaicus]|uniref:Protein lifeguard 2 n=1 Tax=Galemys pyrenaicus TaxID=202257 RepID=A0A8J5ZXV3_GALPY|nr:Protein lifeguard 2 [Galemys pyrenaicus]
MQRIACVLEFSVYVLLSPSLPSASPPTRLQAGFCFPGTMRMKLVSALQSPLFLQAVNTWGLWKTQEGKQTPEWDGIPAAGQFAFPTSQVAPGLSSKTAPGLPTPADSGEVEGTFLPLQRSDDVGMRNAVAVEVDSPRHCVPRLALHLSRSCVGNEALDSLAPWPLSKTKRSVMPVAVNWDSDCLSASTPQLSVANKAPGTEGQQQATGEKKEAPAVPSAPPSYEEATSGEGLKAGAFPPPPSAVPLHPSWAYVDPSSSSSYEHGFPGDHELFTTYSWDDQKVRRVFIRKVYTILLIQLLVTFSVVALFTFCDPVKDYVQANPGWYWASYAVFFATYLTLACCSGPRRHFPWNLILLTIFTLSMAYLTGMLSRSCRWAWGEGEQRVQPCLEADPLARARSYYNTTSVLLCLGITALVCLSVTLFSFQTKCDFTSCQGVLFVLLMTLFFSGLLLAVLLPFQYVPWLHAVYAVLGAGVFTLGPPALPLNEHYRLHSAYPAPCCPKEDIWAPDPNANRLSWRLESLTSLSFPSPQFLAFDTQLLMGNRRHSLSPEEYIFGALNIYLDIIYIFTFFLQLFGTNRD